MKNKDLLIILLLYRLSIVRGIHYARYNQYHGYSFLSITIVCTVIFHNILLLSVFH
jgi:hypothetical protein